MSEESRIRLGRLVDILAANTSYILWSTSTGKRAVLKKLMWTNRTGGNGMLRVGYLTNAVAPVWTPCLPDILMINGFDGELGEDQLPICGNTVQGFIADTTPNTGTLGNIIVQGTVGGAGLASAQVQAEVEEI